ncbi:MAG: putative DNA binding domain-containing protein, partial [Pyramidobacter sp.]|nr:putative DNA binding domain-containing protein [Pyramidobacter sp.]
MTEFKREYSASVRTTVIAYANCDGGTVYIGVNDDGSVCGVNDPDSVMLQVTNTIRDTVKPDLTMFVDVRTEKIDGKAIVCVEVRRGTARPYYVAGKGVRPEGVFVRQGASTAPASDTAILAMIRESSGDSYEKARSLEQELTFHKTQEYFAKKNLPFGSAQMRTLGLIGADGAFTNLALLLSEQCPFTIRAAVFQGSTKTVFRDRQEFGGSLLEQLEGAFAFLDRYNRTRSTFPGLERVDARDYPVEALREALLNSLVHRDYSFSGSILISLFDDRVEFVTIGGLVTGFTLDDISLGVSAPRNKNLANVFYRLGLIEAFGTGLMKIRECYGGCEVQPKFEATNNAFKVTLPNVNFPAEQKAARQARDDDQRYYRVQSPHKKLDP